jgi:hypothetical protein
LLIRKRRGGRLAETENPSSRRRAFVPSLPTLNLVRALTPARWPWHRWPALQGARVELHYLARAGVFRAVRHLLGRRPGAVLMPAYHHGVEVEAVRAGGGAVAFYRVDAEMRVDLDDLRRRALREHARLIYVTHYAGFAQPIDEAAAIAAELGVPLFEDCALSLFSSAPSGKPLGTTGAAACFCLYKTLPVPHGGLLRAPDDLPRSPAEPPPLLSTLHHTAGLVLADLELRAPFVGRPLRAAARGLAHRTVDTVVETVQTGTMHLEPRELELGASALVAHVASRISPERVVARRRRNFERLAAAIGDLVPVFGAPLAPGVCPLFLPVRVADKPAVLARLHARGIDAVDFWSTGDPACDAGEFPEVARLRREILELPCHQSLDDDDVDFVAEAFREALRSGTA